MPTTYPVGPGAHLDVPLSNFASMAFAQPGMGLVGDQLLPQINVGKQSDKYYIIEKDNFLRVPRTLRAPRTEAQRVGFTVASGSYFADNYALAGENSLEDLANADNAIMLRQNTTRLVVGLLQMDQERRIANLVTSISNVGSGVALTGTDKWSDYSGSDPIADVTTAQAFIRSRTGLVPNTMVLDWDTKKIVRRHPVLLDLFKYTSGGRVTDEQLREVFDVERILTPHSIENSGLEGIAASMTNIWGNTCVLAHVAPATGMQSMTFGARFRWRNPAFPADFGVMTSLENNAGQRKVEIVESGYYQDEKVIAADLAYTINDTL